MSLLSPALGGGGGGEGSGVSNDWCINICQKYNVRNLHKTISKVLTICMKSTNIHLHTHLFISKKRTSFEINIFIKIKATL